MNTGETHAEGVRGENGGSLGLASFRFRRYIPDPIRIGGTDHVREQAIARSFRGVASGIDQRLALAATPPNILLIVADDVGAESSSLYPALVGKSGAASMPNLEKLAASGLVFENTWVNPMCSPTRSTIVTGLYGHHTGVLVAGDLLATSTTTIWDYIRKESPAKYDMAVFGKWHLGGNGGDIQHVKDMRVPNFRGFLGAQISDYYNWIAYDSNGPRPRSLPTPQRRLRTGPSTS